MKIFEVKQQTKTEKIQNDLIEIQKTYPNAGVSFTVIDKIGINPRSSYNTPLGIYTYPIDFIINGLEYNNKFSFVPFMQEAPYIWVVSLKNDNNILNIKEYNETNLTIDINKIKTILSDKNVDNNTIDKILEFSLRRARQLKESGLMNQFAISLWSITQVISLYLSNNSKIKEEINSYDFKKSEHVFSIGDKVKITNSSSWWNGKSGILKYVFNNFGIIDLEDGNTVKINLNDVKLINESFIFEYRERKEPAKKEIVLWNKFLRMLGYDAVKDTGYGIIHPSEPEQMVFLNPRTVIPIAKFNNPEGKVTVSISPDKINDILKMSPAMQTSELKKNYKNYDPFAFPTNSLTIISQKLIYQMITYNSYWMRCIKNKLTDQKYVKKIIKYDIHMAINIVDLSNIEVFKLVVDYMRSYHYDSQEILKFLFTLEEYKIKITTQMLSTLVKSIGKEAAHAISIRVNLSTDIRRIIKQDPKLIELIASYLPTALNTRERFIRKVTES